MTFKQVNPHQSFPELEKEIIKYWKDNDIFKKSIDTRVNSEEFNFYDGPPFATGTPHYGHILAGTIKDVIPRYQTMLGYKVDRKFGWDCHGLPIEIIVEKKLQVSGKDDIENKVGVFNFNESCRANVFGYVDEWKKSVERMGRWVDMENDYKTMDTNFMESVWWVFKTIYDKGLIYEKNKIVPYCPRCTTPLSNFEVNQGYKDKQSKTVTVKFKIAGTKNKYILAWTTTPWTLYANLGLAVGSDIDYVELFDKTNGDIYILAQDKIKDYYKKEDDYEILRSYKGTCLIGIKYEPLFPDFDVQLREMGKDLGVGIKLGKNVFTVVAGHHVTTETGTGIVHIAPAYGEDDFIIGEKEDLGFVAHINNSGKSYNLLDKNDINVFELNDIVISELKEKKLSVNIGTITHSYPHCWRCDTPLIYRGIEAWYVAVEKIRDKMVENNKKINWIPEVIKNGRFGKWLEQARDWNISRNRYWGSAIPVWQSQDKKTEVCIGSIEELYQLNKEYGQITKIIFIRHGRTDYNDLGLMDYQDKAKLNEVGIKQSEKIKEKLKNINIDVIYSSPLKRCIDTITPLAKEKGLEINIVNDLIEVNSPDLQDKPFNCKNYKWDNGYGGGEKIFEVYNRVEKALSDIIEKNPGKTIVICSHGDPIYLARQSIYGGDYDKTKYTSGLYLENNPKYDIQKMYAIDYVYTDTKKQVDLHKHFVDNIKLKHPKTKEELKRIPEVLDCWFESGAMPYASKHYPFENKENFKFPADFIAEGIDQTRGWFYTLIILSTALFDKPAFLNCIVNGIVLAEDGKKMSKKLKNYTDPNILMDKYGADAMRFYMMNSPVVEAQDLRFSDAGVEEVVKKVILPFWNAYSFFTTYANIDKFKPKTGNIYYVRHGETDNNAKGIVNGGNDDIDLNENGIKQVEKLAKQIIASGIKFDVIITSPMLRTKHTTKIIKEHLNYDVEVIELEAFKEQSYGEFRGMSHDEIKIKYNCKTNSDLSRIYRNNSEENIEKFTSRVEKGYKEIEQKYAGKNVLIVSHGGVFRPINKYLNNLSLDEAFYGVPSIKNAKLYKLPGFQKSNILDKWIISELNNLIGDVSKNLDNFRLNEAAKPIIKFMDNLTNWYIRRSRKRFWGSEITEDKLQAYNTLYEVLVETCKVIAPYMPFVSEYIFRNLTGKTSVHLELYPVKNPAFIFENLNNITHQVQNIITLGLSARAKAKIRVRQPLLYIKINYKLTPYFEEIIKEELNVKEIKIFDENEIPSQICKPNARLIGPKFGENVKFIISEAKAGNFTILENGNVKVGEFELNKDEFEIEFVLNKSFKNNDEILEGGNGIVIALNTTITEELKLEGYARDIVRHIQEARKQANFNVDDRIKISISGKDLIQDIVKKFKSYIENETLSTIVSDLEKSDLEKDIEIEDLKFNLKLKK